MFDQPGNSRQLQATITQTQPAANSSSDFALCQCNVQVCRAPVDTPEAGYPSSSHGIRSAHPSSATFGYRNLTSSDTTVDRHVCSLQIILNDLILHKLLTISATACCATFERTTSVFRSEQMTQVCQGGLCRCMGAKQVDPSTVNESIWVL